MTKIWHWNFTYSLPVHLKNMKTWESFRILSKVKGLFFVWTAYYFEIHFNTGGDDLGQSNAAVYGSKFYPIKCCWWCFWSMHRSCMVLINTLMMAMVLFNVWLMHASCILVNAMLLLIVQKSCIAGHFYPWCIAQL